MVSVVKCCKPDVYLSSCFCDSVLSVPEIFERDKAKPPRLASLLVHNDLNRATRRGKVKACQGKQVMQVNMQITHLFG